MEFAVCDVLSQPRVVPIARDAGLRGAYSIDILKKDSCANQAWDLLQKRDQKPPWSLLHQREAGLFCGQPSLHEFQLSAEFERDADADTAAPRRPWSFCRSQSRRVRCQAMSEMPSSWNRCEFVGYGDDVNRLDAPGRKGCLMWRSVAFSRVARRECYGRQRPWRKLHECGENSCHTDPVRKRDIRALAMFARKLYGVEPVGYTLHCVR